jgi:hypothetical protein
MGQITGGLAGVLPADPLAPEFTPGKGGTIAQSGVGYV